VKLKLNIHCCYVNQFCEIICNSSVININDDEVANCAYTYLGHLLHAALVKNISLLVLEATNA